MKSKELISEKLIEKKLKEGIAKLGGLCLKYHNSFDTSYPDRIIQLPGAITIWVEVKSTGKKLEPLQRIRQQELKRLGFEVWTVDNLEALSVFLQYAELISERP